ncbi:glycosyltransferase [Aquipuribacter sp. MA13-6]|uniref:glycosyltransferase n=1 Tax=unclassified Aquipuribacter TaxID=2635084 RepID=UPI003EEB5A0E
MNAGAPVLVVLNGLQVGGSQINAIDLCAASSAFGFAGVAVGYSGSLPVSGPSMVDVAAERGVRLVVLDRPRSTAAAARQLRAVATVEGARLVHVYGAWEARPAYWGPCFAGRMPLVHTVYEMAVPHVVLPSPPLIVGTRYLLEEEPARRRGRVSLISPPVDLDRDRPDLTAGAAFRTRLGVGTDEVLLVCVSRLDEEMKAHGVETAIRSVESLPTSTVLVVVGDGDAAERLRALADEVNVRLGRPAVLFTGAMADPRPAYAAADVMFGMGSSAARTLAFGVPLVAVGERGWARRFEPASADELFRNSFWSLTVVEDAVGLFVQQVTPLLEEPARRTDLGAFGRGFAQAHFGLEAMTGKLVEIYRDTVGTTWRRDWLRDLPVEIAGVGRAVQVKVTRRDPYAEAAGARSRVLSARSGR